MKRNLSRPTNRVIFSSVLACSLASLAQSQITYVWDGGTAGSSNSMFTAANWVDDISPVSSTSNSLLFDNATGTSLIGGSSNFVSLSATRTLANITFSNVNLKLPSTLNVDTNLATTTTNRTLTMHSGITVDSSTTVRFRNRNGALSYVLGANNTFHITQSGGQLTMVGDSSVDTGNSGGLVISGSFNISKTGAGSLLMGVEHTFSGGLILEEGRLRTNGSGTQSDGVITNGPFGTGTLTLRGGTLQAFGTASRTYLNAVIIDGDITLGGLNPAGDTLTAQQTFETAANGSTTVTGNRTLDVQSAVVWNQNISGNGSITKTGSAALTFAGANTFTGNLQIAEGTFTLTSAGSQRFTLADAGVTNSVSGAGSANFDGVFVLDRSAVTSATGSWDLVNVSTLSESFGASFALRFLDDPTLFSNLGEGLYSLGDWAFDSTTGTLTLAPIPEPSAFAALAGLAALGLAATRRRRA